MSSQLSSSISLSKRLAAEPLTSTIGNLNIIESGDNNRKLIAYLPYLIRFTNKYQPSNAIGQYEGLAAILLAMEHLNTGNGIIVPELDGIDQRCPLKFTTKAFDTQASQSVGVNHVITMTDRNEVQGLLPTAILGALSSGISMPTSIISGLRGIPQISPLSTSAALDNKSQYKLFGRTIPNDDGTAVPLVAKFESWNVNYVAVLHVNNPYGNAFAEGISKVAQQDAPNLRVETREISASADDEKVSDVIKQLKDTKITYFFAVISPPELADRIMIEAYNQGIAGTGRHTWLFSDSFGRTAIGRDFPIGSPLERVYRGTGLLSAVGGISGIDAYDKLTKSLQQLGENEEDRSYLNTLFPTDYQDEKFVNHSIITDQEAFLTTPGLASPFLYDAVVAIGIASCGLLETSENNQSFSGEELFDALRLNTTFKGASGLIILNPDTGTREPRSALFSLTNFVDDKDASTQDNTQFKGVNTDLFQYGRWEALDVYTFNDGTGRIPSDIPILVVNPNYLDSNLKAVGFTLCGIVVALSLGFSYWTYRNSKRGVVRSSQPIFLHVISSGALLMGLSIIPFTIDLGVTDQKGADVACMAFPWLLATGFSLIFSALFTKTYRINQIMKSAATFKRVKVTAKDVIKPMAMLLMLNTIVLTVWTVIDPLQRETVSVDKDTFFRDIETYGVCSSDHAGIFLAILCIINLGSLLFALFQAYMARKISTELQESSYIFLAMTLILLVSFLGIPVVALARDNAAASYFVTAGLVFVVSASILLLIFVPKVYAVWIRSQNINRPEDRMRSTFLSSQSSGGITGMVILSAPAEQAKLEKEIRELKRLLSLEKEKSRVGDENRKLSIGPTGNPTHSKAENGIASDPGRMGQSEVDKDVEDPPDTAHYEVGGSIFTSIRPDNAKNNVTVHPMGTGYWSDKTGMDGSFDGQVQVQLEQATNLPSSCLHTNQ